MNNPPKELNVGHMLSFIYYYFSKFGDGQIVMEELRAINEIITKWMGKDSSFEENKKVCLEAWNWYEGCEDSKKAEVLERVINLLKKSDPLPNDMFPLILADLVKIAKADGEITANETALIIRIAHSLEIDMAYIKALL